MTKNITNNNKKVPIDIYNFAYIDNEYFKKLKNLAKEENWNYINKKDDDSFPILKNYIIFTFQRLAYLHNTNYKNKDWIVFENNNAIINTGLQTKDYKRIYMVFKEADKKNTYQYYCVGVFPEYSTIVMKFTKLPNKASYISKLEDLLYDPSLPLIANTEHILSDDRNIHRLPEQLQHNNMLLNTFEGALNIVKRKVEQNYRIAVPQFHKNKIQLLLPICLQNTDTPDIVLVVSKSKNVYRGNTCLTLDMAYNNARLIAKPEDNWLAR